MSENDLIRRGDAEKAAIAAAIRYLEEEYETPIEVYISDAIAAIPAAPAPDVAALLEAAKCMSDAYNHWANQASGTPSDTIAAASLYGRSIALRAALSAWEAAQK